MAYQLAPHPRLEDESRRVLETLNRDGIALTSVQELVGPGNCFEEMAAALAGIDSEKTAEIAVAREKAQASVQNDEKTFNYSYIVGQRQLSWDDVFLRFALQKPVLQVANAYLGMLSKLRYCNVWRTFASQAELKESQLWHRDRDDRLILKMFVYLSDVDEGAGPFTYAPGTHPKGAIQQEPPGTPERPGGPLRSTDDEMAQVVPKDRWVSAQGKRGTIVFADTRGFHCGGRARERDRMMFIAMFASSIAAHPFEGHIVQNGLSIPALDKERAFALSR